MTDKCILEAYRNMAVQSVIVAVRDFVYDIDDIDKFRKYCKTNPILDLLGLNREWVWELGLKKKKMEVIDLYG